MRALLAVLALGLAAASARAAAAPAVTALMASGVPGGGVSLSWAVAPGARGAPLELSRDGTLIWKGGGDGYVDSDAAPGEHVYRLRAAGAERQVEITAPGPACGQAPALTVDVATLRWLLGGNAAAILVSGQVSQPEGCRALSLSYRVEGPKGASRSGAVARARPGEFSGTVYLDVSPGAGIRGDAKTYRVFVDAVNERGATESAPRDVEVPSLPPQPRPWAYPY